MLGEATKYAESVDSVMLLIVGISVLFLLGVTAAMIYFVIKYNKKRNPKASQIEGNNTLEILWIVIPTILVLVMFYFGYAVFHESRVVPKGAMTVKVIARMWAWEFEYNNGKKSNELYVPANRPIKLELNSMDVNHSLYIPAFRIKEDVIYGRQNYMVIHPEKVGTYIIACAEYCGLRHSNMYSKIHVLTQKEFEKWIADSTGAFNYYKTTTEKYALLTY
ncbi:MAG: cytochrome c oxidase subunit II [Ignavibacteria bacterium GWB2_35_12]|nr:MAG: cytochrome c oxidase subunit II [Ignavibacteria bacterium GWA2_35_8]OGU40005.1 MAG: cytochrome c oxidase subunit II [Ignavibacteria bacterium GWB2_35_12]OGU86938.1 MAG: cytochrome c oxidase subunit II [Ignavibacteria bacterium RIFOXYA2_FULL_35_10]OGV21981.1 MAG: cytochrome c oxidase subunit II [Ignavibacteria bacterium RIFOXYC2_FULL_35_21]